MKSKSFLKYFVQGCYQILDRAMLEFPYRLYLHSLIFALQLTCSKRMLTQHSKMPSDSKRFCVIDSLTNKFRKVKQVSENMFEVTEIH